MNKIVVLVGFFLALQTFALALQTFALAWPSHEAAAKTQVWLPATEDNWFATTPVDINIGERGYVIPRNYLWFVRGDREAGHDERAVLQVLWPGLEPRTRKKAHLWERRYPKKQIRIHLEKRGTGGYEKLRNRLRFSEFEAKAEPYRYGLLRYARKHADGRLEEIFVAANGSHLTPDNTPLSMDCTDHTSDRAKQLFKVEVLCIAEYRLQDGAWIKIHFFRAILEHWREIDTAVRRLVGSFRR